MRQPPLATFAEKEFYLDEFHEKTVLNASCWYFERSHHTLESRFPVSL